MTKAEKEAAACGIKILRAYSSPLSGRTNADPDREL